MSRQYAINGLPGLRGGVVTHQDGDIIAPGDPLHIGSPTFDLTYWYYPTPADLEAGATPGKRISVAIEDIPISASNREVRNAIMQARAVNRINLQFGSFPIAVGWV